MLSFYASTCLGLYRDAYVSCQNLKCAVIDLMTIVTGTIHPYDEEGIKNRYKVRMEFWRCANLFHLCSYVLADKTRATYNFDDFLVPVASAFGEYNGKELLGMLRHSELAALEAAYTDIKLTLHPDELHVPEYEHDRSCSSRGAANAQQAEARMSAVDSTASRKLGTKASFANVRGDVQSKTAALHAGLGSRLYILTEFVLEHKLSHASWPAWNSVLLRLRHASDTMKQEALFRLPRVYRYSVKFLVASAILTDTSILGISSGRMILYAEENPEWSAHVWFGATVGFVL